jgi:transposase
LAKDTILLSQDESRFCSESNRVTSWSEKGKAVVYSGYRYGTALNCFGSINLKNGHFIASFHERGNADATIVHLQKVRAVYESHIPLAFIMDNATWHKTLKVKEFCKNNNITLLFLPPYSPEYNPIERVWSFLKSKLSQRFFSTANSFREFVYELMNGINTDSSEKLSNLCCSLI